MQYNHKTTSTIALKIFSTGRLLARIIEGLDKGREFFLMDNPVELGTDDNLQFFVKDPLVSPRHIRFEPQGIWWFVRDLDSENGTFLNARYIKYAAVFPGEILRIGNTMMEFHAIDNDPDEAVIRSGADWVSVPRIVAHELKNYIGYLDSGVELLRKDPEINKKFSNEIRQMTFATDRIDELIHVLRAGCLPPRKLSFDLTEQVWEQLSLLESHARISGIELQCRIPNQKILLTGDPDQIGRAIFNLIKNAFEACSPGDSVMIGIEVWMNAATLSIEDSGCGMDSETIESMWTPLFTTKSTGNGLGAFISRTIILKHGGSVSAVSRPGGPTTISVQLPLGVSKQP